MSEFPSARALRQLGDAVGDSRQRLPSDGTDPAVPVAATVVIVRDGEAGVEVLLIERPDRGSFAGAWVFPGGKLEAQDRGEGQGEADAAHRAGIRETWEETGLVLEPRGLVPLSVWDPPPGLALRIRTWFFVAPAPTAELVLAADEAIAAEWGRPRAVLERHARGELTLYPPTWVTLHGLAELTAAESFSAADMVSAVRLRGPVRFETIARRTGRGPMLMWREDAEYAADAPTAASARHRLEVGALPWIYTRAD